MINERRVNTTHIDYNLVIDHKLTAMKILNSILLFVSRPLFMSLSIPHHRELNGLNIDPRRYEELRLEYKDDLVALQQIDVYDPNSEYSDLYQKMIDAYRANNNTLGASIQEQLTQRYPAMSHKK